MVAGHEYSQGNNSSKQTTLDIALGQMAVDFAINLHTASNPWDAIVTAKLDIQSYKYRDPFNIIPPFEFE